MDPESSIRKIVSNSSRKAYASSATGAVLVAVLTRTGLATVAELAAGEYAGGASKEDAL
jgi:hypothetical protein